ncbi:aminotransferase class I/II-fold pyridoxal phosphate-dependent enzyme [Hymenobacter tibetensis]|uniref:Aminotransferase n=1 Tax=Hymenobacter tibetensis TaxID=497967 RepID=A0ABY4CTD6_9BACT|nr:aminotransferase class I/II-fold pyridoxal phosphate-dependent enzyme [Hymenobacter tibetensis]UOG73307.1 aminotransferase class I/II-fold pyridoxal phosphate-dependent enzyme [Hymenobacter tibetensis]
MLHGHGDDGYLHSQPIKADFSTNVWYGGPPAGLQEYVFSQWPTVTRYPEVLAESLAAQVAAHHGVPPAQVLIGSGTTESIYLVAQAWAGRRTTILTPAFAEYEDAARLHGHSLRFLPWQELQADTVLDTDLVFICNPNNPTGSVLEQHVLVALLERHPNTVFVLDEAFLEFTIRITTAIPLLARFNNLMVLRSMTKAYAIPGLRLGYMVASAALISQLTQCKMPWAVNALAAAAGHFLFAHYAQVQPPIQQVLHDKAALVAQLRLNSGIEVLPSHTHFFLAATKRGTAADLKHWLLSQHGLLVRDAANFRGLTPQHFRVGARSATDNNLLVTALQKWTDFAD